MDTLKTGVKKTELGYMGYIQCWNNKILCWTISTKINRPTRPSAKVDAEQMKADLLAVNLTI